MNTIKILNHFKINLNKLNRKIFSIKFCSTFEADNEYDNEFLKDENYMSIKKEFIKDFNVNQKSLVILPYLKTKFVNTTPELVLDETVTLCESVPNFNVLKKAFFEIKYFDRNNFLSRKRISLIQELIQQNSNVNCLVFALDWLTGFYQLKLEKEFNLNIYDRYSIILKIFELRAKTKEAKLQIALAELPYIRSRINILNENPDHHQNDYLTKLGGHKYKEFKKRINFLQEREKELRKKLLKIEKARSLINTQTKKSNLPVISIVGYTNSGKTSLIKYLSKNNSIVPLNKLFATLDISRFTATLNDTNQKVFLIDTIGFISNIPKSLFDAFNCTLKEISNTDLIIHVYDSNHPDLKNQVTTVHDTLFNQLKLSDKLKETMIEVGNKIDNLEKNKLDQLKAENPNHVFISVTESINIQNLKSKINLAIEKNLELTSQKFKVLIGSEPYQFLIKNSIVEKQNNDLHDVNYTILSVKISKKNFNIFMKLFYKN